MRLALDADRYVDLCRDDIEVADNLEQASEVLIPFIVLGELRAGFSAGNRQRTNEQTLARFLNRPGVSPLFADQQTTNYYASIYRQLRTQGTPVPTNDMWLAALVAQHDLVLYTRDRHFDHLPQLRRL